MTPAESSHSETKPARPLMKDIIAKMMPLLHGSRASLYRWMKLATDVDSAAPVLRKLVETKRLSGRLAVLVTQYVDAIECEEGPFADRDAALLRFAKWLRNRDIALRWLKAATTAAERYGPRIAAEEWDEEAAAEIRECALRVVAAVEPLLDVTPTPEPAP